MTIISYLAYNGVKTVETSSPVDLLLGMFNLVTDLLRILSCGTQKAAATSSFLPLSAQRDNYSHQCMAMQCSM